MAKIQGIAKDVRTVIDNNGSPEVLMTIDNQGVRLLASNAFTIKEGDEIIVKGIMAKGVLFGTNFKNLTTNTSGGNSTMYEILKFLIPLIIFAIIMLFTGH